MRSFAIEEPSSLVPTLYATWAGSYFWFRNKSLLEHDFTFTIAINIKVTFRYSTGPSLIAPFTFILKTNRQWKNIDLSVPNIIPSKSVFVVQLVPLYLPLLLLSRRPTRRDLSVPNFIPFNGPFFSKYKWIRYSDHIQYCPSKNLKIQVEGELEYFGPCWQQRS